MRNRFSTQAHSDHYDLEHRNDSKNEAMKQMTTVTATNSNRASVGPIISPLPLAEEETAAPGCIAVRIQMSALVLPCSCSALR